MLWKCGNCGTVVEKIPTRLVGFGNEVEFIEVYPDFKEKL